MILGPNTTLLTTKTFEPLPSFNIGYEIHAKIFNQEGDLKYEYNPFRNLKDVSGELKDFKTDQLNFNLNNPIDITVQPSYDGTVNLILNDDINPPRLINSRFTPIEDKRYKIIDRKGNNDTNLYSEPIVTQTTRLFKTTEKIACVDFKGLTEGGALKSGNYVFYFKYCDADGNESDIIAESGIISCYVGKINDPFSTKAGMGDELTNKIAKLSLLNTDTSYDYVNIYFTRSTSDYSETEITKAYKILNKKVISTDIVNITVTGLEETVEISLDELNIQYNIVDRVKTQAQIQNMLFFGNVDKPTIPYKDLEDLSLRVYPTISNDANIGILDQDYIPIELKDGTKKSEYYDAVNVYKYTGYWNKEIYRLGIVYTLNDDTLSPVFPIRGKDGIKAFNRLGTFKNDIAAQYTYTELLTPEGKRNYIDYDEDGFIPASNFDLENTRGVVRLTYGSDGTQAIINKDNDKGIFPLSIDFNIENDTLLEMKKFAKGFFFVRQKRIPTILAQGVSIGVDGVSSLPSIRTSTISAKGSKETGYITESFIDKSNQLVHDYTSRIVMGTANVRTGGLLCPEAVLRSEYFNEIFTGALFNLSEATFSPIDDHFEQSNINNRHYYINGYKHLGASDFLYKDVKLTLVEDGTPARSSGTKTFSSRAGIPEEAWKYSFYGTEDKNKTATNLVRGSYTGYVGMENYNKITSLVDIHVPGYDTSNMRDYFLLRANSFHPFFAISNRYDLNKLNDKLSLYDNLITQTDNYKFREYRGDCFINTYTTRIQRNFQDPEVPINDTIIDPLTWKNNYSGYTASGGLNKESIAKINRSDVNAIEIGHWVTFKLCSNINLAYRAVDETHSSENALTKKARAFYPYAAMSYTGENKIPESTVVNVGYNSTTSDKIYLSSPDVPYLKNIFDNRIMFSDIHISDAFRNGYRVFQGLDYKDVTRQYGAIVKMFDWKNNLLVVFENGVGMLPINERAMAGSGDGGGIFIRGLGVLSDKVQPLSEDFGSTWKDSIIRTHAFIYGVDTIGKKIWRTNGEVFEVISDFKIQKFLNDNITLDENEKTVMIGLRNVKTHYNQFKGDLMFTFYDTTRENEEIKWNLCFNEQLNKWITRYSWTPLMSESINNIYFSFDREAGKKMAMLGYTLSNSETSEGVTLSNVTIPSLAENTFATLSLKGYNYYSKYDRIYTLEPNILDNNLFNVTGDQLTYLGQPSLDKFYLSLKIRVSLGNYNEDTSEFEEYSYFYDFLAVKIKRSLLTNSQQISYDEQFSTYFWKHGQAGIFDITTPILPTKWYDRQEVFEYEFIVADNPNAHKIFDNLMILSNNAEPDSFEFEVIGDAYDITKNDSYSSAITKVKPANIHTYQKGKNIKAVGRMRGNMSYVEDIWDVEIKPHRFTINNKIKESKIRDKYCKIKVRYSGEKLAIITALQTLYTKSYA